MSYLKVLIFSTSAIVLVGSGSDAIAASSSRAALIRMSQLARTLSARQALDTGIRMGCKARARAGKFFKESGLPEASYRAQGAAETGAMAASASFRTAFAFLFPELSLAGDILRGAVANPIRALVLSRGKNSGEGFKWNAASRQKLGLIAMRGILFAGLFQLGKFAVKDVQVVLPIFADENFPGVIFPEELEVSMRHRPSVGVLGKSLADLGEEQLRDLANMSEEQLRDLAIRVERELADRAVQGEGESGDPPL